MDATRRGVLGSLLAAPALASLPEAPAVIKTPGQAAAEFYRRRQIRAHLSLWCEYVLEPMGQAPAAHHRLLIDALEALTRGDIDRLMVAMPPGSAKSTYVSTLFPAWWLAQNPTLAMLAASNTFELAERFGRRVRNLVQEHSGTLGYSIASDVAAAGQWETTDGGEYFAAGVQGTITGRRADLAVIDDAIKTRAEADSQLIRDRIWDWWRDDLVPRLKPNAKVAVVATRWHEDDLSGRLMHEAAAGGQQWHVLSLPMEAELDDPLGRAPGERLWADWFTADMVADAKREARTWSALYQQRPAPESGDYFRRDWIRAAVVRPARDALRIFGASDYAVTSDGGDWTVHVVLGVDADDRLYLLDLWRGQASSDMWVEVFCDMVIRWKPMGWAEETGQIRSGIGPWLDRRSRERRAFVARTQFPTRGDKGVRAQSIRGRMALSGLYVPPDAPWRADFEAELMSFPAGKHDDQCLAEGTLITMGDGDHKPIEAVLPGDWVATPQGPCEVLASRVTNEAAVVYRLTLEGGATLEATGNHPVMVEGKGFVRIDALNIMDTVTMEPWSCSEGLPKRKYLSIAAIVTGGIHGASTSTIGAISTPLIRAAGSYIGIFGRMSSVRFLPDITFTTAMATPSTTIYPTSNALRLVSTGGCIRSPLTSSNSISQRNAWSLPSGIVARLVAHGIASMAFTLGKAGSAEAFASDVRHVLWSLRQRLSEPVSVPEGASSVAQVAGQPVAGVMPLQAKPSLVPVARESSSATGPIRRSIAPKPAGCVTGIEVLSVPARVRNLTVSRAHVFYANGILTHNCDALGLVGQLLDVMLPPSRPKPKPAPMDSWSRAFAKVSGGDDSGRWKVV